ncbi:MAG: Crp/Fnr family transcriptional regulator [Cyclobacteriaceae bacterium]
MKNEQNFYNVLVNELKNKGIRKEYVKGEFLIQEGQIEENIYLIESGAVRVFHLSEFEEQTIRFGYEGSILNSLNSFINATASEFYIEAMRKTVAYVIDKKAFVEIVYKDNQSQQAYIKLLENLVSQQIEREIDILTFSPSERLKRVLARSPNLFQQIPLKYIASYLRMTPETLSRIRNS